MNSRIYDKAFKEAEIKYFDLEYSDNEKVAKFIF